MQTVDLDDFEQLANSCLKIDTEINSVTPKQIQTLKICLNCFTKKNQKLACLTILYLSGLNSEIERAMIDEKMIRRVQDFLIISLDMDTLDYFQTIHEFQNINIKQIKFDDCMKFNFKDKNSNTYKSLNLTEFRYHFQIKDFDAFPDPETSIVWIYKPKGLSIKYLYLRNEPNRFPYYRYLREKTVIRDLRVRQNKRGGKNNRGKNKILDRNVTRKSRKRIKGYKKRSNSEQLEAKDLSRFKTPKLVSKDKRKTTLRRSSKNQSLGLIRTEAPGGITNDYRSTFNSFSSKKRIPKFMMVKKEKDYKLIFDMINKRKLREVKEKKRRKENFEKSKKIKPKFFAFIRRKKVRKRRTRNSVNDVNNSLPNLGFVQISYPK